MRARTVASVILVFVVGSLAGLLVGRRLPLPGGSAEASAPPQVSTAPAAGLETALAALTDPEERNIAIFRESSPSVAYISNIALRRSFFSLNVTEIPQGTGSGFVWDNEGHVVTNFHVIEGGDVFVVVLGDRSEWEAKVVGTAPHKDLAVLKIDAPRESLRPIPVGSSKDLQVGQNVLAIGNPFGLDHTLTVGVVSALGRELNAPTGRPIRDVIQTDAAINPGNSGGPLLDSAGRLIGINAAIYSPSGASAGIGFAVPVDTVAALVPQLIENGKPIQPGIGVSLVDDRIARRLGIEGVIIYETTGGGPAAQAGLEGITYDRRRQPVLGDVIVAVNGERVKDSDELSLAFEEAGVGATVVLTVLRDRETREVRVRLIALD